MMTAPTRDERREVAKRLRGLDVEITSHDTLERAVDKFMKAVCGDIPFSPIRYSVRNLCGLANMLADLIDPTCEMDDAGDVPASVKDNLNTFFCSECGAPIYNDMTPSYCPYCGCRVTVVR